MLTPAASWGESPNKSINRGTNIIPPSIPVILARIAMKKPNKVKRGIPFSPFFL
jgi:hypothetical protein